MAQVTIGEEQTTPIQNETIEVKPTNVVTPDDVSKAEEDKILPPSDRITGLISEEINDPNKISVTIADKDAPIVILFGPPACGKTMTLVRLTRYLRENGYKIEPIKISFMLVKVSKNGRTICQILEAPGEYYFNPKAPRSQFPRYFNAIKSSKNRKIWTIMV